MFESRLEDIAVAGGCDRTGDVEGGAGGVPCVAIAPKTPDREGRAFKRDWLGIVRRRATGLDEGVDGRVGGILKSCGRLVEYLWDLARDAIVGSS